MTGFKTVSAVAVLALLGATFIPAPATAQTPEDKLQRGVVDFLTGIIEVPGTIKEESTASNPVQGLTVGLVKGFFRFAKREVVGFYEMVTFPFPGDSNYGPILDPEHAWDRFE